MLSRPKRNCPRVRATRQERRRQKAVPSSGSHWRKPTKKIVPTSRTEPSNVARTSRCMVCEISDAKADRPVTRTCRRPPLHPSVAIARNLSTSRIKRWHSNAPVDCWFVTARKTRIVRSGDVSGCSCSMIVLSAKGFNAGPIRPRGSNESSNSGRGEPASICWRNRRRRSRIFSGCRTETVSRKAFGSRLRSKGTAMD